ncbi:LuxR C-terminal-related transcriptional regulator [Trueperella pyogenes]|uniref:LuxR C-terminal-related transcriptional regulator n=1 Tax=Trueperella pyogenes TaxID=1661 RepID=UPI0006B25135|nr:LuxR C-terminal-related transcriptional regulator [Trueperella pyogenes]
MEGSERHQLLTELGVSADAETTYIDMLLNVEQQHDPKHLAELEERQLIEFNDGKAYPLPASSLLNDKLTQMLARSDELKRAIRTVESMEEQNTSMCHVTTTSAQEISRWYSNFIANVKAELSYVDHPPFFNKAPVPAVYRQKLKEGITCRAIYAAQSLMEYDKLEQIRACVNSGEIARVIPQTPFRMLIADHKEALLITPPPRKSEVRGLWVRNPNIVEVLLAGFNMLWDGGFDVPTDIDIAELNALPLNPDVKAVLELLSVGLTDEAISRRLGMSQRTVSRRVADALAYFSATSRFQLGIKWHEFTRHTDS